MKNIVVALVTLGAVACASNTGVVPADGDTYLIAKQAATGFTGLGNLKAEAWQEANQYCVRDGKSMEVINTSETKPPYLLGNYPRAEVQFKCVAKSL